MPVKLEGFREIYFSHLHPNERMIGYMLELRERGYRLAICTNKPQHATYTVLEGLGLSALFDGIAGGDRPDVTPTNLHRDELHDGSAHLVWS